jgi:glycerol-1-phosphate dehydrogenase [NAD(P)+]
MEKYMEDIRDLARTCQCGNPHNYIPIEKISIGKGALAEAAAYLQEKAFKKGVIIADEKTFAAAGEGLSQSLDRTGIKLIVSLIRPDENGDVAADEKSLVQALLEIPSDTDVIFAVGAGTLHDIARFCSAKMDIPFISVPTAPSVDGFTSIGAPLIVKGVKKTFQMTSPIAVFADLDILLKAPKKMIAAGFGDMIAKFTSLADWRFGHLAAGEPYCPLVAEMTRQSLDSCIASIDPIAKGKEEGIRLLIEALIKSGLAMLVFGQSHPASGGEHHLSHFWEMAFLKQNRPAVLHGAKVGVSAALLSDIYKQEFIEFLKNPVKWERNSAANKNIVKNINDHLEEILDLYSAIPGAFQIRGWLEALGGESFPKQLGIDRGLVENSLSEAHHLRDRFTALKFLNEVIKPSCKT